MTSAERSDIASLVLEDERRSIAYRDHPCASRSTIDGLVYAAADREPERIALRHVTGTVSYSELTDRAGRISAAIADRGIAGNQPIVVMSGRNADWPALLLGVLDAGCYYVPVSPESPERYIATLLDAIRPALILVPEDDLRRVPDRWRDAVLLSHMGLAWPQTIRRQASNPDDLAYVIFTSGSTGLPKGVAVTHRNVTRLMVEPDYATIDPDSVSLALSPPSFDASVYDLWPFLGHGASVALYPDDVPTPDGIAAFLARIPATSAFITTGLFHRLVEDRPAVLAGLEVLTGGERGRAQDARRALASGARSVIHCYGPTEATVFTTTIRFDDAGSVPDAYPIGSPVAGTRCYVLADDGELVPTGTEGELWIGGEAVAAGYLDDPDLTQRFFRPDPFLGQGRMYRSGDRVTMDADGVLTFIDRIDEQVKIRGHRIEPQAIAGLIETMPGVRQAIVMPQETSTGHLSLSAYIAAAHTDSAAMEAAARLLLGQTFPAAMMPSSFFVLAVMPLTGNGKIDRNALAALARPKQSPTVLWKTEEEQAIARMFAEVIGLTPEGADEDFFDLGGDSLLAMRLIGLVKAQTGQTLSLRDLYADATVGGIATRLETAKPAYEEGFL